MRGTYSIGALAALEKEGLTGAFDYVIGSSSGAINGAYFVAEQTRAGIEGYCDNLSNHKFINLRRF